MDKNKKEVSQDLKAKTRGHFRRKPGSCIYPPILLNFPKNHIPEGSMFQGQNKLKLVTTCRGDSYVIKEYLTYLIFNLFTDYSFNARLVKVVLHHAPKDKQYKPMFGILLEDEDQMAGRNHAYIENKNLISPQETSAIDFLRMATFEYFIGNTDWSLPYRHNIKILRSLDDSLTLIPVPYDFDHSGIVFAPYAHPPEELKLSSVRERRYRGYCLKDLTEIEKIRQEYEDRKGEIYAIINDPRLKEGDRKSLVKFIDDFYETINDSASWSKELSYPCDRSGTGHIIIKGLKE